MLKYDERGSFAPRDIVARAIDTEMKQSGPTMFFDVTHKMRRDKKTFPEYLRQMPLIRY